MKNHCLTIEPLEARIAPATFTVTNLADSGAGSLRAELAAADSHGGKNTIDFHLPAPAAHSENMITLTSGVLDSKGDVTIKGPGAGKLIINGNDASGIFHIAGVGGTDSPATISGLSLIKGSVSGDGGAIYSADSLTLENVTISGNTATGFGGGVQVDATVAGSSVMVKHCLISGNTAPNGHIGGLDLYANKSVEVTDSIITGNSCKTEAAGIAAGIGSQGTRVVLSDDTVTGNNTSTGGQGGGILIASYSTQPAEVMTISGCVISGNTTPTSGGGMSVDGHGDGRLNITDTTVSDNVAGASGGGAFLTDSISTVISKSIFTGNRTTKNTSGYGGGGIAVLGYLSATPQTVKISGSQISENQSAQNGGGIVATNGLALDIVGSIVTGNHAASGGGGISTAGSGPALVNLTVTGGVISNNLAASAEGGGIYASGDGSVSIQGSKLTGNVAANDGGGIYALSKTSVTIKDVTATANEAAAGFGGGVAIGNTPGPGFKVSGGSFTGNIAVNGGGIYLWFSTGSVLGVTISGNTATNSGGGVGEHSSTVTLEIAKVIANTAPVGPDVEGTFTFV